MTRGDKGYKKLKAASQRNADKDEKEFKALQELADTPHAPFKLTKAQRKRWKGIKKSL